MNDAPDADTLLAHRPFVEALVRRLLRDEHLAEDVVQETWLAALRGAPEPLRSARAWLHRVATNLARRSARDRARSEHRERAGARREGAAGAGDLLERLESHRQVVEAVSALEPAYRAVVLLRFYEDLPPREIARRLGENPSTVRTRLQRALETLRGRLDRAHGGDGRAWALALLPLVRPGVVMKKIVALIALLALAGFVAYSALAPRAAPARSEPATVAAVPPEPAAPEDAPAPAPPVASPAEDAPCVALVRLDDGTALRDATLSVGNDPKLRGTTDAEGRLRIAGEWQESRELMIHAADGAWRMTTGTFARAGARVDVTIERGTAIAAGVFARDGGAPVPRAGLFLGREDLGGRPGQGQGVWAFSDEQGRVRVEFLPKARYRFEVTARGFEGVQGAVDLATETFPGRFDLAPARMLTVRFEGLAPGSPGKEVSGFVQRSGGGLPRRFREKLDLSGAIAIPAPPVGSHGLVVEAGEATPRLMTQLVIAEGDLEPVVLRIPAGVPWTGVVRRADGTPLANRAFRIDATHGESTSLRTDDQGFARAAVLTPGRKTVVATIRDGWFSLGTIEVPAQGTLHSDLTLPGTASFRARLVRGAKPDRTPVVLVHESREGLYGYQIPDGDGRLAMGDLAAGSYALETRGESITKVRTVVLRDGETLDLGDVDLGAAASVAVEVTVPEGAKMPKGFHAYATIFGADGAAREQAALVWLDEKGRGMIADLPPGTHRVRVTTPGFAEQTLKVTAPSGAPVRIALEPEAPKR